MYRLAGRTAKSGKQSVSAYASGSTQVRGLAVPVNKRSSIDPMFGTAAPDAPKPQEEGNKAVEGNEALPNFLAGTYRPNNPNDLSELLRGQKLPGAYSRGTGQSTNTRSRTSAAIGAMRRGSGSAIPTQNLEDAFLPPDAPLASQDRSQIEVNVNPTPIDREQPHPIDAIYGRNDLDERILAAARALHYARKSNTTLKTQASSLSNLLQEFHDKRERTLSIELPNESRPKDSRRVPITSASSTEDELVEKMEDGVLLIAYVTGLEGGRGHERISVCSGFALDGGDNLTEAESKGKGAMVVTCAHTVSTFSMRVGTASHLTNSLYDIQLRGSLPTKSQNSQQSDVEDSSIALAITRSGHIFPITTLLSSLPTSDLILLQLGEEAIVVSDESSLGAPLRTSNVRIRTLPVNPYPAQVGAELCVSSFWGWEDDAGSTLPAFEFHHSNTSTSSNGGSELQMQSTPTLTISASTLAPPAGREKDTVKRERDDAGRSRWGRARLVEYRDVSGQEALPGTYDELAQMDFKLLVDSQHNPPALQGKGTSQGSSGVSTFPPPGSSGGPVVEVSSGSVVGVIRGTRITQLGGNRGDAVPAEKLYEFFQLPGFNRK